MMSPIIMRGFKDENGSWKIICMCRRNGFSARFGTWAMSTAPPSPTRKRIAPALGCRARTMQRDTVVLPQPLSPTSDSVSPFSMWKETPSTART